MQPSVPKIDLRPAKLAEFLRSQAMPIRQQDRSRIPRAIPPALPRSADQLLDLTFGQVLARAIGGISQSPQCSVRCCWSSVGHLWFPCALVVIVDRSVRHQETNSITSLISPRVICLFVV
jgi:hypothetical protein